MKEGIWRIVCKIKREKSEEKKETSKEALLKETISSHRGRRGAKKIEKKKREANPGRTGREFGGWKEGQ